MDFYLAKDVYCLTQLLSHFDDIHEGLLAGADTDAIYLDYAKAFDKVDHQLLLKKLRRYGFNERLISWIKSFLAERYQQVVINCESLNHPTLLKYAVVYLRG